MEKGQKDSGDICAVADLGGRPPTAQNFLDSMQFFGKFDKIVCRRPLLQGILDPPLMGEGNQGRPSPGSKFFQCHAVFSKKKIAK